MEVISTTEELKVILVTWNYFL